VAGDDVMAVARLLVSTVGSFYPLPAPVNLFPTSSSPACSSGYVVKWRQPDGIEADLELGPEPLYEEEVETPRSLGAVRHGMTPERACQLVGLVRRIR
jgi:hypothetical protein